MKYEIISYTRHLQAELDISQTHGVVPSCVLFTNRIRYPFDEPTPAELENDINAYLRDCHPIWWEFQDGSPDVHHSRVAASMSGGGKRRLFILGNYIKQRLLRPWHDWAMQVLRRLPCDGTFDQLKPLRALRGHRDVFSFDLKSATDRWPRVIIYAMVTSLFGDSLASAVVNASLGLCHITVTKPLVRRQRSLSFTVGQPLGYHSSWPLFALSHHFVIWMAAERVYPGAKRFKAYAILGDDVVIADRKVADEYSKILQDLEVQISVSKSLISKSGAFEFAKRFFIKEGRVDVSPISMRALLMCRTTHGLATVHRTYNVSFPTLLRLGGAGYRVLAKANSPLLSGRWQRLRLFLSKPDTECPLAFEFWLGGGKPLDPYLKGRLADMLRSKVRPRELKLPEMGMDAPCLISEHEQELLERMVIRNWVGQWLQWVSWYARVAMDLNTRLTDLLNYPVVETSWRRRNVDPTVHRFGLVWRIFDKALREAGSSARILPESVNDQWREDPVKF